jgi:hypothetical protein
LVSVPWAAQQRKCVWARETPRDGDRDQSSLKAPGLLWSNLSDRIAEMDAEGIDVEALSINPYWYRAERDAAAEQIKIQNEKLAEFCAAMPDRFCRLCDGGPPAGDFRRTITLQARSPG